MPEQEARLSWAVSVNSGAPLPAGRDTSTAFGLTAEGHRQECDCFVPCLILLKIISDILPKIKVQLPDLLFQVACQGPLLK